MFSENRKLSSLNLSNFDISQKDLDYMELHV
jgi:surface protein